MPSPSLTALAAAVLYVPERPERVLEVGCGEGDGVLFLAREYPTARIRGVDPAEPAIAAAVRRVGLDPEGRVAFKQGGGRSLPYPDGFFDLLAQTGGRLRPAELARVTRPDGRLVLVGEWRLLDWRLGKHGFVAGEHGEAAGERFHVYRLDAGDAAAE
jgi:ubiquinone/menaquinone biosynthesis C-methylase UbiE